VKAEAVMRVIAIVLVAVLLRNQLLAQQAALNPRIKQQIAALSPASLVEVRMKDGDKLRGRIASHEDLDFSLAAEKGGGAQNIAYDQVLSVSQVKHSNKKWIIIGVAATAILVVGLIALHIKNHPLG
jgi:hypothetical protein